MIEKDIRSERDGEKPWYSVEIADGPPEVVEDLDGALDTDLTGATPDVPDHVDLPDPAQAAMSSDVAFAVTQDGRLIAYERGSNLSEQGIDLRANLAWYDSESDEFTVLRFVER